MNPAVTVIAAVHAHGPSYRFPTPGAAAAIAAQVVETAQRALWATVHGLLTLHSSRTDLDWPGSMFDETIDAMLRGLVREAPEPTPGGRARRRRST